MHVAVNAAVSADGKLSTRRREQIQISGPADRDRVDELRARSDVVGVGVGTVLADDPHLTVGSADRIADRKARGEAPQPARMVADSRARTPLDAHVLDDAAQTYVLVAQEAPEDRVTALETAGATIIRAGSGRVDLATALGRLESHGIDVVMLEGGGELLYSAFQAELVDELTVFVGPLILGGRESPTLVDGAGFVETFPDLSLDGIERIDDGVLLRWTPT